MIQHSASAVRAFRTFAPARSWVSLRPRCITTAAATAANGDFVEVHYTGTLDDGSVFDSSREDGRSPLEFQIGAGKVIKGFDRAVTGLSVGGTRKLRIDPADAYGEIDPELVARVPADKAPQGLEPGVKVAMSNGMQAIVTAVDDEHITLDLNHELAGQHLTFDVELMALYPGDRLRKATFGMGCFWGPQLAYQRVPGVVNTEVGYSNGTVDDPTYEQVCSGSTGHCEVVQITYDPQQVSYEELLDVFWAKHDPTQVNGQGGDIGTQYRSGIYVHDAEQKEVALRSKERAQAGRSKPIATEIVQLSKYYPAEEYHQQYLARGGRFGRPQSAAKKCNDPIRCYG